MTLDLSSLKKSIIALERSLSVSHENSANIDENLKKTLQAGVIQNFEVAYEQCWKFIQRWIRENKTPSDADYPRTRKELFRLAANYSLIDNPAPWFEYGDARNMTSHIYDQENADYVYNVAEKFIADAQMLLAKLIKLEEKQDA